MTTSRRRSPPGWITSASSRRPSTRCVFWVQSATPPSTGLSTKFHVSFPFLFDALYFSQFRLDNGIGKWMTNGMVRGTQRRLRYELDDFVPDVVVPVFNPAAPVVSHLRRSGYSFRTIAYAPGSFADRWWVQETTDLFLVSSRVAAASIRRFWPEARVEVITDPLRPEYWAAPSQEEARASLGIPPGVPCALVVCGSLGHGRPDLIAKELAEDGLWVIAAGGTNDTLVKRLRAVQPVTTQSSGVRVHGSVSRVDCRV